MAPYYIEIWLYLCYVIFTGHDSAQGEYGDGDSYNSGMTVRNEIIVEGIAAVEKLLERFSLQRKDIWGIPILKVWLSEIWRIPL